MEGKSEAQYGFKLLNRVMCGLSCDTEVRLYQEYLSPCSINRTFDAHKYKALLLNVSRVAHFLDVTFTLFSTAYLLVYAQYNYQLILNFDLISFVGTHETLSFLYLTHHLHYSMASSIMLNANVASR